METTAGSLHIGLLPKSAPNTVFNFVELVRKGYYNGLVFHRVVADQLIQGGCPDGTGRGGPGYTIPDEFAAGLAHTGKGIFSMANAGPNSGGSQFFITLAATPWLDGKHAIFGHVTDGMDVVETIGKIETGFGDRPSEPVVMMKVTVSEVE